MGKSLYIAEKPSVAREFASALGCTGRAENGRIESGETVITWCVGHLVTMSYPEAYGERYRRWSLSDLPFLPSEFKYEVIAGAEKQYKIVAGLLSRPDIETIYVCTDSGREGEYIYRLVDEMAHVSGKKKKRVWIDSQTEEEILRGIREAKDLSAYDNLAAAAYLRAKEDYLMGINFSRLLTLKYGQAISACLKKDRTVLSAGRVMTCVLGMTVRRERQIRNFTKTPFYRVIGIFSAGGTSLEAEWKSVEGSAYFGSPCLYRENGFKKQEDAQALIARLRGADPFAAKVLSAEKKKEKKNPPLLYNLAELQNECAKRFKISPDETLRIAQELYEKKLLTYPRTDARVLSTAAAREIDRNLKGLLSVPEAAAAAARVLETQVYRTLSKSRYVNDKQITDHYALVPTGQGTGALRSLSGRLREVYLVVVRRFLSIFYPPAVYRRITVGLMLDGEFFSASSRFLLEPGYLEVAGTLPADSQAADGALFAALSGLRKGQTLPAENLAVREGETAPPKRYTSGSMILAMENAGQLIEDEELRAQIRGSGIGTSATRAGILQKLVNIQYMALNSATQVLSPTLLGEMVYEAVDGAIPQLLNPELTASWEKGLSGVAAGTITPDEYMEKLTRFVALRTRRVKELDSRGRLAQKYQEIAPCYQNAGAQKKKKGRRG